jgi:hypothetical protein
VYRGVKSKELKNREGKIPDFKIGEVKFRLFQNMGVKLHLSLIILFF